MHKHCNSLSEFICLVCLIVYSLCLESWTFCLFFVKKVLVVYLMFIWYFYSGFMFALSIIFGILWCNWFYNLSMLVIQVRSRLQTFSRARYIYCCSGKKSLEYLQLSNLALLLQFLDYLADRYLCTFPFDIAQIRYLGLFPWLFYTNLAC